MHHRFMDSLSLYRVIALLERGWGQIGDSCSPNSCCCCCCIIKAGLLYLAAAADAWQQPGPGWWSEPRVECNMSLCLPRQQDEHQLLDLVLLPFTSCRRICRCERTQCLGSLSCGNLEVKALTFWSKKKKIATCCWKPVLICFIPVFFYRFVQGLFLQCLI